MEPINVHGPEVPQPSHSTITPNKDNPTVTKTEQAYLENVKPLSEGQDAKESSFTAQEITDDVDKLLQELDKVMSEGTEELKQLRLLQEKGLPVRNDQEIPLEKKELSFKERSSQLLEKFKSKVSTMREKLPNLPKPTLPAFKTNLTFQNKLPNFTPLKEYLKKQADSAIEKLTDPSESGLYYHLNEGGKNIVKTISEKLSKAGPSIKQSPQINLERPSEGPADELNQFFKNSFNVHVGIESLSELVDQFNTDQNKDTQLDFTAGKFIPSTNVESKTAQYAFTELLDNIENQKSIFPTHAFDIYQLIDKMANSELPTLKNLLNNDIIKEKYKSIEQHLVKLADSKPDEYKKYSDYINNPNRIKFKS